MKKNDTFKTLSTIVGTIVLLAVTIVFMPFISFWLAYFGGWICSLIIGEPLCNALNTLFGTTRFTPGMLPWIAAAFGWIGGYFKKTVTVKKD